MPFSTTRPFDQPSLRAWLASAALLMAGLSSNVTQAQQVAAASLPRTAPTPSKADTPDFWQRHTLLEDWGGLRPWLAEKGISFTLNQTSDYVGNTQGGIQQGFGYDGLLDLEIEADLNQLIGWQGASFHVSGYGIQGADLSISKTGSIMTATSVEAQPSVSKLGEVWINQKLFDDTLDLRAGQIEADRYFVIAPSATVFVNSTFGFPDPWEASLPGGGPAYPNPVMGGLLIYNPNPTWTLQAAVMNGNPTGRVLSSNQYGTSFPVGQGTMSWLEAAYNRQRDDENNTLAGVYKFGGWYNTERIDNVTLTNTGRPLSNPVNMQYQGLYSVYGLIDQALWRAANSETEGVNGFFRLTYSPQLNRNLVNWYFDTGLTYTGLFDRRPQDVIALGFAWANISPYLNTAIATQNLTTGSSIPKATFESVIEATYQAPISPWLTLQPFFQYAINPGGKAPMPNNPSQAIPSAVVVGLRANVSF